MRDAEANGEPPDSRCETCMIRRLDYCPEIPPLARDVLAFGAVWDHPAHEGYREMLWEDVGPALSPADVPMWLAFRQAAWEEYAAIARERAEKEAEDRRRKQEPR